MSKKKIDEAEDMLKRAEKIVSYEKEAKDLNDKSIIQYVKFLFTKEYTLEKLSLPVKKKEKEPFQYLYNFVKIIDVLFQKKENERNDLYYSEITSKKLGIDLFNCVQNMKRLEGKINFDKAKRTELNVEVHITFSNYLKMTDVALAGFLNLSFYYLGFFIPSINTFNLLLFYFVQLNESFQRFQYKDFCPDLNNANCLNLILLFFKNIKKPLEILVIYAILIFKYQYIFLHYDKVIERTILERSVNQTENIVKQKTLKNPIIFEYIWLEFSKNLNNNNNQGNSLEMIDQIISDNPKNEEDKFLNNKNIIIQSIESTDNNNGKKSLMVKPENANNGEDNSEEKNSKSEEIKTEKKHEMEEEKIKEKENENSTSIDNNNSSLNGTKETNISNLTINEENGDSNLKNENNTNEDKENNLVGTQSNQLYNIENLIQEMNEMKKENDKRFEELIKKNEEREKKFDNLLKELTKKDEEREKKLVELEEISQKQETEITEIKTQLNKVIITLGHIQIRDKAKNILRPFESLLDKEDIEQIKNNKKKKWELIASKIKENYRQYEKSIKYKAFVEIVEKSAESITKGNDDAHQVILEYYEKNIDAIIQGKENIVINPNKMCFLLLINVPKNLLIEAYNLLQIFYQDNMTSAFTRGNSLEGYFQ